MAAQPKTADQNGEWRRKGEAEAKPVPGKLDLKAFHGRIAKRYPKILAKLAE